MTGGGTKRRGGGGRRRASRRGENVESEGGNVDRQNKGTHSGPEEGWGGGGLRRQKEREKENGVGGDCSPEHLQYQAVSVKTLLCDTLGLADNETTHSNKNTVCANYFGIVCTNSPPSPLQ